MNILDVPGFDDKPDTELGKLSDQLERLINWRPGRKMWSGGLEALVKIDGRQHSNFGSYDYWMFDYVDKEKLEKLKVLLDSYGVSHEKPKNVSLCCDETTKNSDTVYFLNCPGESLLLFSSDTQFSSKKYMIYVDKFTPEDERLERVIVEENIRYAINSEIYEPTTTMRSWPDVEQAQKYIKESLDARLLELKHDYIDMHVFKDKMDAIQWHDSNSSDKKIYIYPEGTVITKDMHIVRTNIYVPFIVKTYPDGMTIVAEQTERLPLEEYFSKKQGLHNTVEIVCPRCKEQTKQRILDEYLNSARINNTELFGETAESIGYKFDLSRLKIKAIHITTLKMY